MSNTFLLPDLGEGLSEAEIVRWLVAAGDVVVVDQPIVEVETAKSLVEVPSPYAGRVAVLHGAEGEAVDVGKPLITIEPETPAAPQEKQPPAAPQKKQPAAAPREKQPAAAPQKESSKAAEAYREEEKAGSGNVLIGYGTAETGARGRRRRPRRTVGTAPAQVARVVSPLVRKLARDGGIDVAALSGTGVGGVVTRSDVKLALQKPEPAGERRIPLNGFRKAVSASLTRSRSEIPEATVWVDVDATPLWDLRESTRPGPGLLAYIARFVVAGLREFPVLNSRLDVERQEIVESEAINLGLAVQTGRGLVVPAVLGAERMTTTQLDTEIRRVTASAREGRATAGELSGGTFTLNNYGGFNVDGSAAIINHPQVAILGFGRILDRPWVVGGQICVRKIVQMSFVFDHRVCDGGTAAGFMRSVADAMENPATAITRL